MQTHERQTESPAPQQKQRSTVKWSSGTNIALGLWLMLAPFALAYSGTGAAVANDLIVGLVVLGLAWARVARPARYMSLSWTNVAAGTYLLFAPFLLGYGGVSAAVANDITVGVIVLFAGAASAVAGRKLEATTQ